MKKSLDRSEGRRILRTNLDKFVTKLFGVAGAVLSLGKEPNSTEESSSVCVGDGKEWERNGKWTSYISRTKSLGRVQSVWEWRGGKGKEGGRMETNEKYKRGKGGNVRARKVRVGAEKNNKVEEEEKRRWKSRKFLAGLPSGGEGVRQYGERGRVGICAISLGCRQEYGMPLPGRKAGNALGLSQGRVKSLSISMNDVRQTIDLVKQGGGLVEGFAGRIREELMSLLSFDLYFLERHIQQGKSRKKNKKAHRGHAPEGVEFVLAETQCREGRRSYRRLRILEGRLRLDEQELEKTSTIIKEPSLRKSDNRRVGLVEGEGMEGWIELVEVEGLRGRGGGCRGRVDVGGMGVGFSEGGFSAHLNRIEEESRERIHMNVHMLHPQ
ncbi:hypothetical protein Tco_0413069 [Tanacetum coccineum]